ncbi:PEP-CTERM sorting domain-containing protein [Planctomycetales bacterium ZRK34]|nr:PEP-CTERM sorting domain-containing protein [Planctomycetales bacterium ZRK34]
MKVSIRTVLTFVMALTLSGAAALAQHVHAGDIEVIVDNGQIATTESVYGAELGEDGIPNEIADPGFDAEPGTFSASKPIGFNILDALRVWNGADFSTIADETISVTFSSLGPITTPTIADTTVTGFTLNAGSDGTYHKHLTYTLNAPAETGVYLLKMQLFDGLAELESSDPFYLVFNQNDTEVNHDAAIAFVESSTIPEPAGIGLMLVGCSMLGMRRRRVS